MYGCPQSSGTFGGPTQCRKPKPKKECEKVQNILTYQTTSKSHPKGRHCVLLVKVSVTKSGNDICNEINSKLRV